VSDLALGAIVATLAAVPLSLLLLAVADVLPLRDVGRRHRWIDRCLLALVLPAALVLGVLFWGWAGAAHLGPLCAAYASPEYRNQEPLVLRSLLVESDQEAEPAWAGALLQSAGGPLEFIEREDAAAGGVIQSAYGLQARRITHHQNRWFKVEMDRFRLVDRSTGGVLAEGDELWIRAGRATYHCGLDSGPEPTTRSAWPHGDGVARFVTTAAAGPAGRPRAPR